MKKITKITLRKIPDHDADTSYLGEFSQTPGDFAIDQGEQPRILRYFNAANVENMEQARSNYDRVMEFENGDVTHYGIRADAEIATSRNGGKSWLLNTIRSGGLWGIESDSDQDYFDEVGQDALSELKETLKVMGFIDEAINASPVISELQN